jgi:glycine/D-amino acid oxidase-like deaminating enzyme
MTGDGVRETFARSLWSAITPPAEPLPWLAGDQRADCVVVGAGILGLSLALHLRLKGASVAVIESDEPGFGASGRNTGFVVPSFTAGLGPADVSRLLGPSLGERLSRFVGGSAAFLFSLVKAQNIACNAEPNGWLQPAPSPARLEFIEKRVRQWHALGQPVRLLDRQETETLTGSRAYFGALLDTSGGQINPLAYVRGLARATARTGAAIFAQSRVETWSREAGRWRVATAKGSVLADQAFFTTNALVGPLIPVVARSLIPARPYQVATQPLGDEVRARILPKRQPVADLHRHTFAYRWSPDNRLVTGGLAVFNTSGAVERMAGYFLNRLGRYLPDLPPLEAAFAWNGVVATTPDLIPEVWTIAPGGYAPIGCNGRGVAVTTALGAALADFAVSGKKGPLPLRLGPPRPHAMHALLTYGPSLWLAWNRLRDAIDDRQSRPA